jgi:hypothetical protein
MNESAPQGKAVTDRGGVGTWIGVNRHVVGQRRDRRRSRTTLCGHEHRLGQVAHQPSRQLLVVHALVDIGDSKSVRDPHVAQVCARAPRERREDVDDRPVGLHGEPEPNPGRVVVAKK